LSAIDQYTLGTGAFALDDSDVGWLLGDVSYALEVEAFDVVDTSVMPEVVLERRPLRCVGVLTVSLAKISSANLAAIFSGYTGDTLTVHSAVFVCSRPDTPGEVSISMDEATISAASITFHEGTWNLVNVTFRSLGLPTVTGL
jgi:hypothetical protein